MTVRGYDDQGRGVAVRRRDGAARLAPRRRRTPPASPTLTVPPAGPARLRRDARRHGPRVPAARCASDEARPRRSPRCSPCSPRPAPAAGSGAGEQQASERRQLTVTRDFGAERLGRTQRRRACRERRHRDAAAAAQLRRRDPLRRRLRAGDRRRRGRARGRPPRRLVLLRQRHRVVASGAARAQASRRATAIWWDHHDWSATMRIPAVVGSFPEPFVLRQRGQAAARSASSASATPEPPCDEVETRLARRGRHGHARAPCSSSRAGREVLRVLVGPWARGARATPPRASSSAARPRRRVRAGPTPAGDRIDAARPARARRAHARRGRRPASRRRAIEATSSRPGSSPGTDAAGVAAAAAALTEDELPTTSRSPSRTGRARAAAGRRAGAGRRDLPRAARARCTPRAPASARAWCLALGLRRAVVRAARSCSALLLASVLAAAARRRASGGRCARALAWGVPFALVIALVNALVTRDGADRDRPRLRPCPCSGSSTSRSRRSPTARSSALRFADRDRLRRAAARRRSTPTSCCARCGASRCAPA